MSRSNENSFVFQQFTPGVVIISALGLDSVGLRGLKPEDWNVNTLPPTVSIMVIEWECRLRKKWTYKLKKKQKTS